MQVLRRTDYPGGRFTNAFVGYGPEIEFPALELTHNWDQEVHYDKGNGWGHICIETPDVYKAVEDLEQSGAKIIQNDVLRSPPHKGGSRAASRPPSRSILEVFWDDLRTNFDRFSKTFEVISRCVV